MTNDASPPPQDQLHTIFVDTSIGTHLAMVVSIHDTINDVKAKIRDEHALCFKDIGEISIKAIKVRRRCFFYNLSDSMYILNAFDGIKGSWRVCIDVIPMRTPENQKTLNNEDTHDKHYDYKVPVLGVDGHQDNVCELSPKNQDSIMNNDAVNTAHLDNCVFICKRGESSHPNGQGSKKTTVIDHKNVSVSLIDHVKDALETSDAIPSDIQTHKKIPENSSKISQQEKHIESPHHFLERKRLEKLKDGLHVERLEDFQEESKLGRAEDVEESNKLGNFLQQNILPLENTLSPQNPVGMHLKTKKRKSSKAHEDVHFTIPSETIVCRLHPGTTDLHNLENVINESIFSEKCLTKSNNDKSMSNNTEVGLIGNMPLKNTSGEKYAKRRKKKTSKSHADDPLAMPSETPQVAADPHISAKRANAAKSFPYNNTDASASCDTENFLDVSNQKVVEHSLEILNEEPFKEWIHEINPDDQSKKHVNSGQERKVDVSIKERDEDRNSSQALSEFPTELHCNTNKLKRLSSRISKPKEFSHPLNKESEATKCVAGLNFQKVKTVSVDSKTEISASAKKQVLTKVDSKGLSKSKYSRKKSKVNSPRVCEPAEVNEIKDHFNMAGGQVSLNGNKKDISPAKFINHADQNMEDLNTDFVTKMPISSKKDPSQEKVSNPDDLSKAAKALVKHDAEIRVSSQKPSEAQSKPHRSRISLKSGPTKLEYQENCDVPHSKIQGTAAELIDGGGPDQSKLTSMTNQKMELLCVDAKAALPLAGEDSSMLIEVPQVISKLPDFSEQSNAKSIIKGIATHTDAMSGQPKPKVGKKKSKNEALVEDIVASKTSDHTEPHILVDSIINFDDYFIPKEGKNSSAVRSLSKKSETEKKKKSRKTNIIQPFQDSLTNLVQPSNNKQDMAASLPQENDASHVALHSTATKYSMTGIARKSKEKKSGKPDTSHYKSNDKYALDKEPQDKGAQSHVQTLKPGAMGHKQGNSRSLEPNDDFDNIILNDLSPSIVRKPANGMPLNEGVDFGAASSDSTEDIREERRYRLVRKNSRRNSKGITKRLKSENALLASSMRIFSDASGMSSESENAPCKKKVAVDSALDDASLFGDSESYFGEGHTNASELNTKFSGTESDEQDETSKGADGNPKIQSLDRPAASTQKAPLSTIFKGSSSYKKVKLIASQSEFPDDENQPADVVLETQPETALP